MDNTLHENIACDFRKLNLALQQLAPARLSEQRVFLVSRALVVDLYPMHELGDCRSNNPNVIIHTVAIRFRWFPCFIFENRDNNGVTIDFGHVHCAISLMGQQTSLFNFNFGRKHFWWPEAVLAVTRGKILDLMPNPVKTLANGQIMSLLPGQLNQVVSGDINSLLPRQLRQIVSGDINGLLPGQLKQIVSGDIDGLLPRQLRQTVSGDINGLLPRQLRQIVSGDINGLLPGQLKQIVSGDIDGLLPRQLRQIVSGDINGLLPRQLRQIVSGDINGLLPGQLRQIVSGDINGLLPGQLKQIVSGDINGLLPGQLKEIVRGDIMGLMPGPMQFLGGSDPNSVENMVKMGSELTKCSEAAAKGDLVQCLGFKIIGSVPPLNFLNRLGDIFAEFIAAFATVASKLAAQAIKGGESLLQTAVTTEFPSAGAQSMVHHRGPNKGRCT